MKVKLVFVKLQYKGDEQNKNKLIESIKNKATPPEDCFNTEVLSVERMREEYHKINEEFPKINTEIDFSLNKELAPKDKILDCYTRHYLNKTFYTVGFIVYDNNNINISKDCKLKYSVLVDDTDDDTNKYKLVHITLTPINLEGEDIFWKWPQLVINDGGFPSYDSSPEGCALGAIYPGFIDFSLIDKNDKNGKQYTFKLHSHPSGMAEERYNKMLGDILRLNKRLLSNSVQGAQYDSLSSSPSKSLFNKLEELLQTIKQIEKMPYNDLISQKKLVSIDKIRKYDSQVFQQLVQKKGDRRIITNKLVETLDIYEHRIIKSILLKLGEDLTRLSSSDICPFNTKDSAELRLLQEQAKKSIENIVNNTFLRDVKITQEQLDMTQIFACDKRYRKIYDFISQYTKNFLNEKDFSETMRLKKVDRLYEYWILSKIIEMLVFRQKWRFCSTGGLEQYDNDEKKYKSLNYDKFDEAVRKVFDILAINSTDYNDRSGERIALHFTHDLDEENDEKIKLSLYYQVKVEGTKKSPDYYFIISAPDDKGAIITKKFALDAKYKDFTFVERYKEINSVRKKYNEDQKLDIRNTFLVHSTVGDNDLDDNDLNRNQTNNSSNAVGISHPKLENYWGQIRNNKHMLDCKGKPDLRKHEKKGYGLEYEYNDDESYRSKSYECGAFSCIPEIQSTDVENYDKDEALDILQTYMSLILEECINNNLLKVCWECGSIEVQTENISFDDTTINKKICSAKYDCHVCKTSKRAFFCAACDKDNKMFRIVYKVYDESNKHTENYNQRPQYKDEEKGIDINVAYLCPRCGFAPDLDGE